MAYRVSTDKSWAATDRELKDCFRKWRVTSWEVLAGLKGLPAAKFYQTDEEREVLVNFIHPGSGAQMPISSKGQERAVDNFRVCFLAIDAIRLNEARGIADVVREAYLALPSPAKVRDPYEVLGLRPDAPDDLVDSSYRALSKKAHPDAGGSEDAFRELTAAHEAVKKVRGLS